MFTGYVLLDAFVIPREYVKAETLERNVASSEETSASVSPETGDAQTAATQQETEAETEQKAPVVTENSYEDENIKINITTKRISDADVYIADVVLSSPIYLNTAFAKGVYGKNVKAPTSDIAEEVGAIFAVNGDFYGARDTGFVMRGGVIYRDVAEKGTEALIISENGKFSFADEDSTDIYTLKENGAYDVLTFGPALVINGRIYSGDSKRRSSKANPRTAIGYIDENHYVFVVVDGRTDESEGLTLSELASVMKSLRCVDAYNLDGGGSATMYFNGRIVNTPTFNGNDIEERKVSDIVYIGY